MTIPGWQDKLRMLIEILIQENIKPSYKDAAYIPNFRSTKEEKGQGQGEKVTRGENLQ